MYTSRYFTIQELVPPSVFKARGARSVELLDSRVLITLDQLRDAFGPIVCNTWHSPSLIKAYGLRQESGLRVSTTQTGATFSQHKYGRAVDCLFVKTTADAVRKHVLTNPDDFPHITCIEDKVSWFHFDVRNCERILVVQP